MFKNLFLIDGSKLSQADVEQFKKNNIKSYKEVVKLSLSNRWNILTYF